MINEQNKISACFITDGADLPKLTKAVFSVFSSCFEVIICANKNFETVKEIFQNFKKVQVYEQVWEKDFSKAKNEAIDKAKGEWILIVDSDEELQTPIKFLNKDIEGFLCELYCDPVETDEGVNGSHYEVRLFQNKGYRYKGKIHEQVIIPSDKLSYSNVRIKQDICKTTDELKNKIQRNLSILEADKENPYRDYLLCQVLGSLGKYENLLYHTDKVLADPVYNNSSKALACIWAAMAMIEYYKSNEQAKQMLLLSIVYEPMQIAGRKMLCEILEKEKAPKEVLISQYELLNEINSKRSSRLTIDFYYSETFLKSKLKEIQ